MKYKDVLISVNYGNLLLQALLEHWWRPLHADDEIDSNSNDGNGPRHARGGNPYFSVPGHTPVIFRLFIILTMHGKVIEHTVASAKSGRRHCHLGAASRSLFGLQRARSVGVLQVGYTRACGHLNFKRAA